jgi:hypothetical protein
MKRSLASVIFLILLLTPSRGIADGKIYTVDAVAPRIPHQRALILLDGSRETLILQTKYETPGAGTNPFFGWVVPIPSMPELTSMSSEGAFLLFHLLASISSPDVTKISSILTLLMSLGSILIFFLCLLSFLIPGMTRVKRHHKKLALFSLLAFFLAFVLLNLSPRFFYKTVGVMDVEVIKTENVGIYDVRVVRSSNSKGLISWLKENQFQFEIADIEVFDQYIHRGWCFVVAKINPASDTTKREAVFWDLIAPLILRFPTSTPVYPLALTATSNQNTEILLYVMAGKKVQTDERFELFYAGKTTQEPLNMLNSVEAKGFFSKQDLELPFLCKFKGTLTPAQMREDLKITFASDNEPYRQHIVKW